MKLGTLLNNLGKKAGVDTTLPDFVSLLAHDIEVPDEIANKIDKGLMNEEVAKTKFKTVHRSEALNGVDKVVEEMLSELGYSDEEIADIKEEKNSYEKVSKLARTIKTLEGKKASKGGEGKEALEKKIEELNKEIKAAKQALTEKETEFNTTREADLTDFLFQSTLMTKEYALPKEMDSELVISTAKAAVNKALAAKGLKIVRDPETKGLKIVDKDGNKAYSENHEEIQLPNFIDGALAQNKLLKVNDSSQGGGGKNGSDVITTDDKNVDTRAISEIDSQLKDLGITA